MLLWTLIILLILIYFYIIYIIFKYTYPRIRFCFIWETLFQLWIVEENAPKNLCWIHCVIGNCLGTRDFVKLILVCKTEI